MPSPGNKTLTEPAAAGAVNDQTVTPPEPPSNNQSQPIEPQAPEFVVPEVSTTLLGILPMLGALYLSKMRKK